MLFSINRYSLFLHRLKAGPPAGLLFLLLLLCNRQLLQQSLSVHAFVNLAAAGLFVYAAKPVSPSVFRATAILVLLLLLVSFRMYTGSTYVLAVVLLGSSLFYIVYGRFSLPALLVLLLCSGVADKLLMEFSTLIKQQLCNWVYISLKDVLHIQKQEGVHLWIGAQRVSIDTACMGLSMLRTGFLCMAALLSVKEKQSGRYFSLVQYTLFILLTFLCIVLSNYFRIVLLLLAGSAEDGLLHQSIGMACFAFYVLLPLYLLLRVWKPRLSAETDAPRVSYIDKVFFFILLAAAFGVSIHIQQKPAYSLAIGESGISGGCWIGPEVYKIEAPGSLTYIKTASHSPMLCWTGSGYKVLSDFITEYQGKAAHCTLLEKDGQRLHSYWWYENGTKRSLTFYQAMLRQLIGKEPARLVNVTVGERQSF